MAGASNFSNVGYFGEYGTEHVGHLPTRCSSSVIHNDLVFIVYGAILRRYYKVIGYSTVEQPPKKTEKTPIWDKKNSREALSPAIL